MTRVESRCGIQSVSAHSDSGFHLDFIIIIVILNVILFGIAVLVRNKMYSSLDVEIIEATLEGESGD